MVRFPNLIALAVLAVGVAPEEFARARAEDGRPPNILVFVADDVSWKDFGCYGHPTIRTPNIDRLAENGLRCENAFLTTSSCSPTRVSVLTGKYPHATGAEDLHMNLPAHQRIVPAYLRQAGYHTGHMLKTHYGPEGNRQFDWYGGQPDAFEEFLDETGERPFFCWVGFREAHRPYQPDTIAEPHTPEDAVVPPFLVDAPATRADLALYYDEIALMDEYIGAMIDELEERDQLENTFVVFFSDNGMPFPRAKGSLYDSGIGTPLIFQWPERIEAGTTHAGLASMIDLAPTILEVAGLRPPAEMQGHSMLPVLDDPSLPGSEAVLSERNWHNCDEHMRCVRTERFKLIRNAYLELPLGNPSDVSSCPSWEDLQRLKDEDALTPAQARLFQAPRPVLELYDLEADPWETTNLAGDPEYAEVVQELLETLDHWVAATGDFPPIYRRRADNCNRVTGVKFTQEIAPMTDPLPPGFGSR